MLGLQLGNVGKRARFQSIIGAMITLASLLPVANAATTFAEGPDAGQLLITAQLVNTMPGGTALTEITGNIDSGSSDFADLFKIFLIGGQTFSASTLDLSVANFWDTQLMLFDSNGIGVYANDDDAGGGTNSLLPSGAISFSPVASGIYYLAISGPGYLPTSAGGRIFPGTPFLNGGVVGPTGPGGASALSGWQSTHSEAGDYSIALTGAQFLPDSVPEPATVVLVAAGLAVAGLVRRRIS